MEHDKIKECEKDYEKKRPQYDAFTGKLHDLIKTLLDDQDIEVHQVDPRTKKTKKLIEKIQREGKSYENPLEEITDLSGIRIIAFYLDDIGKIGEIIKNEFKIDEKNSDYGAQISDPESFGYTSDHYIVSLAPNRKKLAEWKKCAGLKAEIQVRTILQHAWATVSHKLAYKSKDQIPVEFRRKFSRLSALFEIADDQFEDLKIERKNYQESVAEEAEKTGGFNPNLALNPDTLKAFLDYYFPDVPIKISDHKLEWRVLTFTEMGITMKDIVDGYKKVEDILQQVMEEASIINDKRHSSVLYFILALTHQGFYNFQSHYIDEAVKIIIDKWRSELAKGEV